MFTSPQSRRRTTASARRQLLAVITAAFIVLQSVFFAAPQAVAQRGVRRDPSITPNVPGTSSTIFINEILYDITGTDAGEFVEVAGPAGTDLTGWSIVLYNGTGGASYDTDALPSPIPSQQGGYGTVSVSYASNGIQNGSPDGIALVNNGTVVQFLCYEGTFAATNGPANGLTCTDIGVSQSGTNAAGTSLQLQGTGTTAGNFTWNATSIANTQNAPNTGQTFTGGPPVDNPPTVASTVPADNALNVAVNANVSVTFNEPVNATASSFQISCATSGTHAFTLSGGPTTYTLDPTTDFTQGEVCTVTVFAAQVTDQDGTADQMAQDFVFDFTVVNSTPVAIHDIQGSGATSPLAGQTVTTSGVVTLLRTSTNNGGAASGFFLQAPDANADADPNTSEGIFVFTSSVPTVAVGDEVTVTGTVVEFNGMTEISPVSSVTLIDTGNPLPTPITLTTTILDPTASPTQPQLEKFEGMRMSAASLTTTAPNDNFFDVYTVITGVPRPLREPGIPISLTVPPDPTSGVPDPNVPRWDENPERLLVDTNGRAGAPLNAYTSLVVFTNVVGPLDFAFAKYRLIPDATPTSTANISVTPAPTPTANEFTVVGTNIRNFNNNATQRQKAALAIRDVLRLPDIIGLIEIFDLADLQALAAEIQTISGVTYSAHLIEADGTSEDSDQDVAFLVKTSRVQVNSVVQRNATETYTNPNNGQQEILNDRPPLVLNANVEPAGANVPVIVVVNHTRSFIDIDQDPGEGPRVRAKRKAQAESLAALLQEFQTNNPTTSVISVGDYNAFQFSSGYDDSLSVIKGNPTPDDQIVVDQSPDLVNPNFLNLVDELPISEQYSFNFEGTLQALDHILVNTVAKSRNTRSAIIHNNSDFPEVPAAAFTSNATRPESYSDHDIPIAYFSLVVAPPASTLIISEFRLKGPGGDNDEFVEIYNNTDADITVATTDGSAGFALAASDGVVRFTIPNGTVIPARGHYLGVNSVAYSLASYPAGIGTTATGDATYATDIVLNNGIALFNTATPANFSTTTRLDAVGSNLEANTLYREGAGYQPLVTTSASAVEHTMLRDPCGKQGNLAVFGNCPSNGFPVDSNDNATDFFFADTNGTSATQSVIVQRLGAPGPENLSSPIQRNQQFGFFLLDATASSSASPNRVRDFNNTGTNRTFGALEIRRRFVNNTGGPVTRLRFRIIDVTTFPSVTGRADLRALTSTDLGGITVNDAGTCGAVQTPPSTSSTPPCNVTVRGVTLEEPPTQPNGGGFNSSLSADSVTITPLAPGESINIRFLLGVQATGSFRFYVNIEADDEVIQPPARPLPILKKQPRAMP
ncbi:MAG: Ig-like domain-containing protein [Rubrivivax sp.]|nr:Ig-like domain-containing protein [Pyrinomonadaceae bacterium]